MTRKLIIEGNAVYEIDEECMLKNRVENDIREKEKDSSAHKNDGQEKTAGSGRMNR